MARTKHPFAAFIDPTEPEWLVCPYCKGESGMHMSDLRVEVDEGDGRRAEEFHFPEFERQAGPLGEVKSGPISRKNPLCSRGARLSLRIWCDACGGRGSYLTLGFHKGMLLVGLELEPELD